MDYSLRTDDEEYWYKKLNEYKKWDKLILELNSRVGLIQRYM